MGVRVSIRGFRDPTDKYLAMVRAYQALDDAGLAVPVELENYFKWGVPNEHGMEVDIDDAIEGRPEYEDGAVIDLDALPNGVTKILVSMG